MADVYVRMVPNLFDVSAGETEEEFFTELQVEVASQMSCWDPTKQEYYQLKPSSNVRLYPSTFDPGTRTPILVEVVISTYAYDDRVRGLEDKLEAIAKCVCDCVPREKKPRRAEVVAVRFDPKRPGYWVAA